MVVVVLVVVVVVVALVVVMMIIGRFRKHNATSNATWYVIFDRGGLSRTCCLRRYWRENCVEGPQKQGAALRTSENNYLRCESQALATSWFTGSRAQAIRRHVTSRFGVALCFLNLPNDGGGGDGDGWWWWWWWWIMITIFSPTSVDVLLQVDGGAKVGGAPSWKKTHLLQNSPARTFPERTRQNVVDSVR